MNNTEFSEDCLDDIASYLTQASHCIYEMKDARKQLELVSDSVEQAKSAITLGEKKSVLCPHQFELDMMSVSEVDRVITDLLNSAHRANSLNDALNEHFDSSEECYLILEDISVPEDLNATISSVSRLVDDFSNTVIELRSYLDL